MNAIQYVNFEINIVYIPEDGLVAEIKDKIVGAVLIYCL